MPESPPVFSLDRYLAYQLSVLSERIGAEFSDVYRERFGISRAEWRVLVFANHAGEGDTEQLHLHIHLDKSTCDAALHKLASDGRIQMFEKPDHGAGQWVKLTDAGRDLLMQLAPVAQEVEQRILGQLGAEAHHFKASLETLLRTMWHDDIPLKSTFHNVIPTHKGGDPND